MSKKKRRPPRVPGMTGRMGRGNLPYVDHPDGSRTIHLDERTNAMMQKQLAAFEEKFGREPGPNDPLFFDPDEDEPVPLTEEKLRRVWMDAGQRAGFSPEQTLKMWERFEEGNIRPGER